MIFVEIVLQHLKNHPVLFFVLLTGKLYAIGVLIALNSRTKLRERMESREVIRDIGRMSFSQWRCDPGAPSAMTTTNRGSFLEVILFGSPSFLDTDQPKVTYYTIGHAQFTFCAPARTPIPEN